MTSKNFQAVSMIFLANVAMFIAVHAALKNPSLLSAVFGYDFLHYFKPATLEFLSMRSPYTVEGFYSPPWLLPILVIPSLIPDSISVPLLFVVNISAFTYTAWKSGVNRYMIIPFIVFSGVLQNAMMGNVDGIVSLGMIVNPWVGFILLSIKPQVAIPLMSFIVIFNLTQTGKRRGFFNKYIMKNFTPLLILTVLSFLAYGAWFMNSAGAVDQVWNTAIWPRGILIGILMMFYAISKREFMWSMVAIPFLTPYLSPDTWAFAYMGALCIMSKLFREE